MAEPPPEGDRLARLNELAELSEQPFVSRAPIIGPAIAAFRAAWNSVSTRWYVRPLAHQQTLFNQNTVAELTALRVEVAALRRETAEAQRALADAQRALAESQAWLSDQDRDQTELRRDLGELAVIVGRRGRGLTKDADDASGPAAAVEPSA